MLNINQATLLEEQFNFTPNTQVAVTKGRVILGVRLQAKTGIRSIDFCKECSIQLSIY